MVGNYNLYRTEQADYLVKMLVASRKTSIIYFVRKKLKSI